MGKTEHSFLEEIDKEEKGRLKIYIGGAPGVGKTYQMLRDANDMRSNSIDVVVGLVETYDRADTKRQLKNLEVLPPMEILYKDVYLKELNLQGILDRKPKIVVIDELAHTNAPGSKNKKRYEDVLELLDAGISVMTAVNIQHIESLNDYINRMTGVRVRETIPDMLLHRADDVEVIDVSPKTLIERLKNGKIYADKERVDTALSNFFREGNLIALRELTLREIANEVDEKLLQYKNQNEVEGFVGAKEKILVCVNLNFNAEYLIRRAYRLAKNMKADLFVVFVSKEAISRGTSNYSKQEQIRELCSKLDADFKIINSPLPVNAIIKYAKDNAISQIVLGQSARTRFNEIIRGSIVQRIMRKTKYIDILVVSDPKR